MPPPIALPDWTAEERSVLRKLDAPHKIQRFLDELAYDKEPKGPRCRSPRMVLRDRVAHCMEGALMGAASLQFHGYPPLLLDLEAVRDDDHVLAIYRRDGLWGAVAKSNYSGIRSREPVYRTLRELAMSYFEHYFNLRGEKSLRAYSRPVNLNRFAGKNWATSEEDPWFIPEYLCKIQHEDLLTRSAERVLARMDRRLFEAGKLGRSE